MYLIILSIIFSVLLLVNFRLFPKFEISTLQAIAFNYPICFITGYILMPDNQFFNLDLSQNWTWYCLALGLGFILTFILSGLATQKIGMTLTSLANNVSLVIPVLFSLLVLNQENNFDAFNYLGISLAILSVAISTFKADKNKKEGSVLIQSLLAVGVFLMYGITNTTINYLNLKFIPNPNLVIPVTLVMILGAAISGILLLAIRLIQKKERFNPKNIIAGVTLGIPNFLSFYFLLLALTYFKNNGAYVYPIYNIGVILVSALISITFFKEKLSNLNKIGLLMAIVAIALISWQGIFA